MAEQTHDTAEELLACALDIGEQMLISGGEVNRVEDTIYRICRATGAVRVDVYTITSSIVVTMTMPDGHIVTQTRRISKQQLDMNALDHLNALSRYICREAPTVARVREELQRIKQLPQYSFAMQVLMYAVVSFSCSLFFAAACWTALQHHYRCFAQRGSVVFVENLP